MTDSAQAVLDRDTTPEGDAARRAIRAILGDHVSRNSWTAARASTLCTRMVRAGARVNPNGSFTTTDGEIVQVITLHYSSGATAFVPSCTCRVFRLHRPVYVLQNPFGARPCQHVVLAVGSGF